MQDAAASAASQPAPLPDTVVRAPAAAPPPGPAPTGTEIVHRPTSHLQRGRFEAPPWAFWVMGGVILLAAAVYGIVRYTLWRRRKRHAVR